MGNLLGLCLAAALSAAAAPAAVSAPPVLRAGVSVELPVTTQARPLPEADQADALVLAITRKPTVYLGITPFTPAQLTAKLKADLPGRASKNLFLKADARAPYSAVVEVLAALRQAGIDAPFLLTAQRHPSDAPGSVPPKGLQVHLAPPAPSAVVVEAQSPAPPALTLKIAGERTTLAALHSALSERLHNRPRKQVLVEAGAPLPFGDVVQVLDLSRAAGAEIFLAVPGN